MGILSLINRIQMTAIQLSTIVEQSTDQVSSPVDNKLMILQIKEGNFFELNTTGKIIWEKMELPLPLQELINQVAAIFHCQPEAISDDVMAFQNQLHANNLIRVH